MKSDALQAASATTSPQTVNSPVQPAVPAPTPASPVSPQNANTSPSATYANDLRHITSNQNMAPAMKDRTVSASTDKSGRIASGQPHTLMTASPSQHRVGSRSPNSIPSSPTSVHSSSSAIFERDIEPPLTHLSPHPHPSNPHRTPRSKATEPIESGVPSVLDSAAELLTTTNELEEQQIAVEAPASIASCVTSAVGSPVGRGSRSPSPSGGFGRGARTSMLLNLPSPVQSSVISVPLSPASVSSSGAGRVGGSPPRAGSISSSPKVSPPPLMTSFSTDPIIPGGFSPIAPANSQRGNGTDTPSSIGASTNYESASSSPKTTTLEHPPNPLPTSPMTPTAASTFAGSTSDSSAYPQARPRASHPPSPSQTAHKRLSFLSYNDMLSSTPVSTLPLSSLTSPNSDVPPPHIPSVALSVGGGGSPLGSAYGGGGSRSASLANSARNSLVLDGMFTNSSAGHVHSGLAADVKEPSGGVGDDLGGEWEREGLGRGLEERLEALMAVGPGKA